ncbi:hypothetical protein LPJ61_003422 [Coemansia biformis]|uniref:Uncharacterized protein n=1 Tax=Coemansia biformis TaxID=1286918 RepID=A0A9W7Y6L4_9FUNG|nr:hypothetical protein LPJ61_003422 [Coemansia biformis]
MGKALKVSERDPAVAAVVLWSVAKELAQHTQHCDSLLRALEGTQKCLRALEADPGLRSAKGSQAAWTARSLVKTALECDLALARLLSASAKERSASEYTAALCRYLGIEQGALDEIGRLRDPLAMSGRAAQVAAAIPRKFAKPEDVAQAVEAMEEVASAQLAFSASAADNQLAQRGLATHFLRYSFALEKELPDAAFQALLAAASAFRWLGHDYFGNECAMLIIARHMDQPAARTHVATAIVASLRASDPVRARVLLENYNSACTDPWSQFLAEFTARSSNADVAWLSSDAWREWDNVLLRSPDEDRHILELVEALLTLLLEHYSWYASSSPASHHG